MKIYRLDFFDRKAWRVKWYQSLEEAQQYQIEANRTNEQEWDLTEYEIGDSIGALVGFLNYHAAQITDN